MNSDQEKALRKQLAGGLSGGESHTTFDKVVKDFPVQARGAKPAGAPHSAWELVEHMRIAQRDILDFSRNAKHTSPKFPEGYWPKSAAPPNEQAWDESVKAFQEDENAFAKLLQEADLFTPLAQGDGQTLLREAVVLANHNSYQLGQLVFLKRMIEAH